MFRRIFALSNLIALAVLASFVGAEPAAAQNQGYSVWARRNQSWSSGSYYPAMRPAPYYYAPAYTVTAPVTRQSFYPPQSEGWYGSPATEGYSRSSTWNAGSPLERTVWINVAVPPNAEIWFDDAKTTQRGENRQFVSPPLIRGQDYSYEVKATWTEIGKEVTRSRRITVHAGDVINVSFGPRRAALGAGWLGYQYTDAGGVETRSYYYGPEAPPLPGTGPSGRAKVHLDGTPYEESGFHPPQWGTGSSDAFSHSGQ